MQFLNLIFALMLVITIVVVCALEVSFLFRSILNKLKNQQVDLGLLKRWAPLLHSLAIIGIICFSYGYLVEPYRIEVRAVDIFTEKLKKANLRIVQISFWHTLYESMPTALAITIFIKKIFKGFSRVRMYSIIYFNRFWCKTTFKTMAVI